MSLQQLPQIQMATKRWTTKTMLLVVLLAFMIGIGVGSLSQKSAVPTAPIVTAATVPPSQGQVSGGFQALPSPEVLQSMVAPMMAAIKTDPKNSEPVIVLANFYYDHKMFPEAIKYYQRAIELDPKNVDVRTDLGTSYLYLNENDKAVAEFEKALRVQPDYPQTLMNLGIARMERLNDNAGALKAWKQLLKANPDFPQRQRVLSLIAQAEKR